MVLDCNLSCFFYYDLWGGIELSIEVKDCKKCVHVKSEANPEYFGGCEFCFRRNDLSDFYTEGKEVID